MVSYLPLVVADLFLQFPYRLAALFLLQVQLPGKSLQVLITGLEYFKGGEVVYTGKVALEGGKFIVHEVSKTDYVEVQPLLAGQSALKGSVLPQLLLADLWSVDREFLPGAS